MSTGSDGRFETCSAIDRVFRGPIYHLFSRRNRDGGQKTQPRGSSMLGASIIRHIRHAAARFVGASEGNVAVIFTPSAIPIIGMVGAAIDYTRMNEARSTMQSALDSTALMLSKDLSSGKITASEVSSSAQAYFQGLFNQPNANAVTVSATYNPDNGNLGSTVTLNG